MKRAFVALLSLSFVLAACKATPPAAEEQPAEAPAAEATEGAGQ